jgi:hypothetical protein
MVLKDLSGKVWTSQQLSHKKQRQKKVAMRAKPKNPRAALSVLYFQNSNLGGEVAHYSESRELIWIERSGGSIKILWGLTEKNSNQQ